MTQPPSPSPSRGRPLAERWREIEATLERALDLEPAARADFLDRACAGDAELRSEVESLLAATPLTGFLERPVLAELGGNKAEATPELPDESSPRERSDVEKRLAAAVADRYAIERELGRGGMAIVYLARDLRHRRRVAMKVLYPELSAVLGPDRFLKEIELTASLQHPHILPLYDSGSADGMLFYVMPFVEGETLRVRLARERHLPVGDALRIAREVADALTYAHARRVIHRDIKPENILLLGDHAVVADFGIALAVQHAGGERMTRTGLSLGTPQYMAPEQAMGDRVVDARADVYALGAVTYEMLAGEAPFAGPTAQAVVARVLTESAPPLAGRRPTVPPDVEAAVRMAMEKIPADRFASAAAFAAALADPTPGLVRPEPAPSRTAAPRSMPGKASPATRSLVLPPRALGVLAAALVLAGSAGGLLGWWRGRATAVAPVALAEPGPTRFAIEPDSAPPSRGAPALSPDGRTLVYAAAAGGGGGEVLFARALDDLEARPIKGTSYAEQPFLSPDGRWVGYFAKGAIWKVRLDGGAPELVSRLAAPQRFAGATWGANSEIVYGVADGTLFRVGAGGGQPAAVAVADRKVRLLHPRFLPGDRAALVTVIREGGAPRVGVLELATGSLREFGSGAAPRLAAGQLVFAKPGGGLFRQGFDVEGLRVVGSEVQLERTLDPSAQTPAALAAAFDAAPNGTIAYRSGAAQQDPGETRLVVTDRSGRELQVIPARVPWSPRFSPDGERVAYGAFAPGRNASDLWITELATGATRQLTADDRDSNDPRWSPDGRAIAFSANVEDGKDLFVQPLDDSRPRHLTRRSGSEWPSGWSSDGQMVLFTQWQGSDARDVWMQPVSGAAPRPVIETDAQETGGTVSPDGRWVAYQSDESGRQEIYVESFPIPGHRTRISDGGGLHPMWRGDGGELYYWQDDLLMAVKVKGAGAGERLALADRTPLFRTSYVASELPMYDVSRDGRRFVLVASGGRPGRLVVATGLLGAGSR